MKPSLRTIQSHFEHIIILLKTFEAGDVETGYKATEKIEAVRIAIWQFLGLI